MCKRIIWVVMAALLTSSYGICQNSVEQEKGDAGQKPGRPSHVSRPDKRNDQVLQAILAETVDKYVQREYLDAETGEKMEYNLFIPENYDESINYPLLLFIGDASTAHKEVTVPLTQGYGGVIWATAAEQAKHPCFVVVPQYTTVTVNDHFTTTYEVDMTIRLVESLCKEYSIDKKRLYTTGQSMGGMMSMYFNVAHPKFFAASLYVGCQWDTSKMGRFANDSFVYGVSAGDDRASKGMADLRVVFEKDGVHISDAEWSARLPEEEQAAKARELLAEGNNVNFIVLTKGTTLPEGIVEGMEHMFSFDYIYRLEPVRDWLFEQRLE